MQPLRILKSSVIWLDHDNIDTDQIIPARFLKGTERSGLGEHLFADWRDKPGFVLSRPEMRSRTILFAGANFGCGSSREHAPWAILGYGIRAVIARSFGDIFKANALKNGLLPISVSEEDSARLRARLESDPDAELSVDAEAASLDIGEGSKIRFPIDPFAQRMLLAGSDELDYLRRLSSKIDAFERRLE